MVLLVGFLPVFSACDSLASKSSDEPEAAAIAETPEAYRAHSAELRREGKHQEAANAALKAYTLARTGPRVAERIELAKAFGAAGNSAGAINEIKSLEKEKRDAGAAVDEVNIAEVYAQIGDPNAVFRWLARAVEAKSPNLPGIENNPDLEPVKNDPRWQQFLATLK
jgi:lipopolysaccharide biosynthesis regulator YciM